MKRHQSMRSHSRVPSRAASPALSTKSRKSVMSNHNVHRTSYIGHDFSDENSSGSDGYLEDFRSLRCDRRDSQRSMRSSRRSLRNSPPRVHDMNDDSEQFSQQENGRGGHRHHRERRAGSATRSISSRADRKIRKNSSDTADTQNTGSELGTRAKVQAKIREKIAQQHQSSLDESSSDFFKPKSQQPLGKPKVGMNAKDKTNWKSMKVSTEAQTSALRSNTVREQSVTVDVESITATKNTSPERVPIGPPPKTPNYEWECEYCTFSNEQNTKICAICCKTPSNAPLMSSSAAAINANSDAGADADNQEQPLTPTTMNDAIKGRDRKISRKISFWPGTKTK